LTKQLVDSQRKDSSDFLSRQEMVFIHHPFFLISSSRVPTSAELSIRADSRRERSGWL